MCELDNPKTGSVRVQRRVIYLPIIAGVLHLHVLYRALSFLYATLPNQPLIDIEYGQALYFQMELSVLLAYGFDLFCCAVSVVPYSRCKKGSEIVVHHTPVFLILLPLGIPVWKQWSSWEPMLPFIQALGKKSQSDAISLLLRANGWGFVSSLNEAIMCFQKTELSLHGLSTMFDNRENIRHKFFTSWTMEFLELSYKVLIFWVFPVISFLATLQTDRHFYNFNLEQFPSASFLMLLYKTYITPLQLRSVVWRIFIIVFYPSMGKRTINKLRRFLENKNVKQAS